MTAINDNEPTEYQRCGSCCTPAEACSLWSGGNGCCPQCFHWRTAYANGSMFDGDQNGSTTPPDVTDAQ